MVSIEYIRAAMELAAYKHLPNDGVIYGEIPGFRGVYATGNTAEVCREKLEETLKDWAEFRLARGMAIPGFEGHARVVRA